MAGGKHILGKAKRHIFGTARVGEKGQIVIPKEARQIFGVQPGDTLVTSGIGGLFPAGLSVGRVEKVDRDPGTGFAMAVAEPLSHPERYRHFLVLRVDVSKVPKSEEIERALGQH